MTVIIFSKRKILVTAALPYANGELHLGHPRSTYLPADVFTRYCRLRGHEVLFVCATDEHGTPIEFKAEAQKISPLEFVKIWRERHKQDFDAFEISFDVFYQTHSPENEELAAFFYSELNKKGLIYEKTVLQTFCENCNRVLPDRYVKGKCPKCGAEDQYGDSCEKCGNVYSAAELIAPKCAVCGRKPSKKESRHFFFKLSVRTEFCKKFLKENKNLPQDVVNYLMGWVEKGLEDWDITRDGPYFGIKIPGAENKFFYVWFDAPIGYVSSTKKYCDERGLDWKKYWTKNSGTEIIHFIGKDIQYFHFLFWPAMLDGAGFSLPFMIPTRGYLNFEAQKMSKSRGTFITIAEALKKFPADYYRYYLSAITPNNTSDGNFLWSEFQSRVNSELIDKYANFVYRTLSILKRNFGGVVPKIDGKQIQENDLDKQFLEKINSIAEIVANELEQANLKEGLEKIMGFAGDCNRYFNAREPWKLLKANEKQEAQTVIFLATKAAFALTQLLYPFVPSSAEQALKQFDCELGEWGDFSQIKGGHEIGEPKILFKKIEGV